MELHELVDVELPVEVEGQAQGRNEILVLLLWPLEQLLLLLSDLLC